MNKCKYYPCHKMDYQDCKYCYCPLYQFDCTGDYTYTLKGDKDCSNCTYPHDLARRKKFNKEIKDLKLEVILLNCVAWILGLTIIYIVYYIINNL